MAARVTHFAIHAALAAVMSVIAVPLVVLAASINVEPYLKIHGQTAPSLSPDGSAVAFSFDGMGMSQVWVEPLAGGERMQITTGPQRAGFKAWSPVDPNLIVFGRDEGGDENWQFLSTSPRGGTPDALVEDAGVQHNWGGYSFDGRLVGYASNARNRQFFDVYTVSTKSSATSSSGAHLVFRADGDNRPVAWSHDGSKLLVSIRTSNFNNDLLLVDLHSDTYLGRLLTDHTGDADYESCAFSGDDAKLYCVSDAGGREHRGRTVIDLATGTLTFPPTDQSYDIDSLVLSRDGARMAYVVNRDGYGELMIRETGTDRLIATAKLPPGVPGALEFSAPGDRLVFDFTGPTHPSAIWDWLIPRGAKPASAPRQVTIPTLGGIAQSSFVEPTLVRFPSFDGLAIPAWYYKPAGATGPLPVIVNVHGGPEAQARPVFDPIIQFFVASGYAVLVPNVRGSSGYGNTYLHLADVRKRLDSVKDLHAAHEWLVASGGADPKRIALYGGSYGGFMVLAGLTNYPDDWAAGVDVVGISNFVTFLEHTSPYRRVNREAVYGSLEHDRAFLESISPLNHVDSIKAPLIIFMGQNDPRVPASEGRQMTEALKARGVPVELTVFPDEGHGIARDDNRVTAYTKIAAFLDQYLGVK